MRIFSKKPKDKDGDGKEVSGIPISKDPLPIMEQHQIERYRDLIKLRALEEEDAHEKRSFWRWYKHTFKNPLNLYFIEFILFFCAAWWGSTLLLFSPDLYDFSPSFAYFDTLPITQPWQGVIVIAVAVLVLLSSLSGIYPFRAFALCLCLIMWGYILITLTMAYILPGTGGILCIFLLSLYCMVRLTIVERGRRKVNKKRTHYRKLAKKLTEEEHE